MRFQRREVRTYLTVLTSFEKCPQNKVVAMARKKLDTVAEVLAVSGARTPEKLRYRLSEFTWARILECGSIEIVEAIN